MTIRRPRPAGLLVAVVALCGALAALAVVAARWLGLRRVAVAGESMTPTLQPGDFVVLRPGPPPPGREYGHIVAVHDPRPEGDGRILLKRIVGLPGESLRVGGGPVQVNGQALIEPYAHGGGAPEQHRGINRLGPDEYFLLGDHRGASTDSRDFGPVHRDRIVATAIGCYWPPERWGRLRPPRRRTAGSLHTPPDASTAPSAPDRVHDHPLPVLRVDRPGGHG